MTRLRSEVERTRAKLAICQSHGINCPVCSTYRARLAELGELHASVAPEHRAKSSGALGTPDRNHQCPDCRGLGEVSIYPCPRCLGAGELTANRKPSRESADLPTRKKLSDMRAAGRIGRRS